MKRSNWVTTTVEKTLNPFHSGSLSTGQQLSPSWQSERRQRRREDAKMPPQGETKRPKDSRGVLNWKERDRLYTFLVLFTVAFINYFEKYHWLDVRP
jgi:hypothetical protein